MKSGRDGGPLRPADFLNEITNLGTAQPRSDRRDFRFCAQRKRIMRSHLDRTSGGRGARLGIVLEGLFHLEISAGRADDFSHEIQLKELKAVPKSASLPDNGTSRHATEGDGEIQLHDLIECNFHAQDSGNTRFADVDGIALERAGGAGIDRDVGADFETRLSARVDYFADCAGLGMFLKVQLFLAFRKTYSECTADGDPRPC